MAEYYVKRLYNFLDRLSSNNNREWFAAHKSEYDDLRAQWLNDIDRMIAHMAAWDPELATQSARSAAFRIYRDTRFSPDKTPYKTFFSAAVSAHGRSSQCAGYYIEIGIPRTFDQGLYSGIWCLDAPLLRKLRHAIVDNIEEWEEIVNNPRLLNEFPQWCSSELKTVPKGWPRNHPQAQWLRKTNYGVFSPRRRDFFTDPSWPEASAEAFSAAAQMVRFLNYSLEE